MKFLKKIFEYTLVGKFINIIIWLYNYIMDYEYVAPILYSEDFKNILYRYLNVHFKKDWIGRLYAVINPNIDINGKLNFNNVIIELDDQNTNNNKFVSQWVYKQMSMVQAIIESHYNIKMEAFFEMIGVKFAHVGPSNQDNYLIIFDIISRKQLSNWFKKFILHLLIYISLIYISMVIFCL